MIDVVYQVNALERRVGSRVLAAGEARTVTLIRTYSAELEDVWDACTNPERIPRWFLPVSGELRVAGRYQLQGNASGTIQSCNPPHSFSATWEFGGDTTWIDLRLSSGSNGQTRLELEHIAHVDDERWLQFGPGALGVGWDLALLGLGRHLSTGATLDPHEAMAWTASSEGKQFIAMSSEQWGAASVAAGTPAPEAQAAADRTTAFYTGTQP